MRTFLFKKLISPDNQSFLCTAWNKSSGTLACGGENGHLEIFQIYTQGFNEKNKMYFLDANAIHTENITCLDWLEKNNSLVSGDATGNILAWKYCGGSSGVSEFMKEQFMLENTAAAVCVKWSPCGQQICIGLSNGSIQIIMNDGTQVWDQDNLNAHSFVWSPSGESILVALKDSKIIILDKRGNKIGNLSIFDKSNDFPDSEISAIQWYNGDNGWKFENCPALAICLRTGLCILMKDVSGEDRITIKTEMAISCASWNKDGSVIAIGGTFLDSQVNKVVNIINFYSVRGKHINSIKLGDGSLNSISWNDDNSILAIALQNEIIFVSTKHKHHWSHCGESIIFSYPLPYSFSYVVRFWNQSSKIIVKKLVKNLEHLQASSDYCCIVAKHEETFENEITLYNSIGTPLDSKNVIFTPSFCQMNENYIVVASSYLLFLWEYKKPGTKLDSLRDIGRSDQQIEKLFFAENDTIVEIMNDLDLPTSLYTNEISCLCLFRHLGIGRIDGSIIICSIPNLSVLNKIDISKIPYELSFNTNSEKMAMIDFTGELSLINISDMGPSQVIPSKSNVWDFQWAQDNPDLLAVMSKQNLYVLRGEEAEEVFDSEGYIHSFSDLRITTLNLDRLASFPDYPNESLINISELKSIRIVRSLIDSEDFEAAKAYISENSHKYLWNILGESALQHLKCDMAELCYTMCQNYGYIQFIKSLRNINDNDLKKAKVMILLKNYKDAENIYLLKDRKDLIIKMWSSVGNYFQVNKVLKKNYNDTEILKNNNFIGNYYADLHKWREAISYLKTSNTDPRLIDCYYAAEDFDGIKEFSKKLPGNDPQLPKIAKIFEKAGMYAEAVEVYGRMERIDQAIDVCIKGNQWRFVKKLTQKANSVDMSSLLSRNIDNLLKSNQMFEAISLCQETGNYKDAVKFVVEFVKAREAELSLVTIKKLYVLAGFLWNENKSDSITYDKIEENIENPWIMASAYHFLIQATNFIRKGNYENGFWSAHRLLGYQEILKSENIHSLLALCACVTNRFRICSREFLILERSGDVRYKDLAYKIFSNEKGKEILNSDTTDLKEDLLKPVCYFSGKPVNIESHWQCKICKHGANLMEIKKISFCPLCHSKREDY